MIKIMLVFDILRHKREMRDISTLTREMNYLL